LHSLRFSWATRLFLTAYFLSGCAGLLYQVTWSRLLALHMGHTLAAVSTVLAAFMGGLAIGAALVGRHAARLTPHGALRLYAWMEVGIAGAALLFVPALVALEPLLTLTYADGSGGAVFGFARAMSSLVLVSIPAAVMGATFPVSVQWFASPTAHASARTGTLYAVNTVGAASGAAAAGFLLIPSLGLRITTLVGVALNGIAAAVALYLATACAGEAAARYQERTVIPAAGRSRRSRAPSDGITIPPSSVRLVAAVMALSGFVALVLEVAWTRVLALILGPTTHAFSLMLTIFIAGLGVGSLGAARLVPRIRHPLAVLSLIMMAVAAGTVFVTALIDRIPLVVGEVVAAPDVTYVGVLFVEAALAAVLLLPVAIALGAAFPLAIASVAAPGASISRQASIVYACNTAGAVGGALAAGFLLIPWLGLQRTSTLAGALAAAAGLVLLIRAAPRRALLMPGCVAGLALTVAGISVPPWNRAMLSSGAYKYSAQVQGDRRTGLEAGRLVYYKEGAAGIVSVRIVGGVTSLAIDGKVDASNAGDMLTQKLLAHVPMLLHPAPRTVNIIGLGSGVTLGAALRHPIERADVVEISPEVVQASAWFESESGRPLDDGRTRLIIGDGRTHLLRSTNQYDVIISEPSNPWMAGLATLFTRDFFEAARDRLAPGGLFCQWAHTYDISDADLRSIVATFGSAFPEATIWLVGEADILLIGGKEPVDTRLEGLSMHWDRPGVAADLAAAGVHDPFSVLSLLAGGRDLLAAYGAGARIQTDDHMPLEFSAPRSVFGSAAEDRPRLAEEAAARPPPAAVEAALDRAGAIEWRNRGLMLLRAHAYEGAYASLARAVELDPRDREALNGLLRVAFRLDNPSPVVDLLHRIIRSDAANTWARIELSRFLAAQNAFEPAVRLLQEQESFGDLTERRAVLEQLASIAADAGDVGRLEQLVQELTGQDAEAPATLFYTATLRFLQGRVREAAALAERAVDAAPEDHRAYNLLGVSHATIGHREHAREAFIAALDIDPQDAATYVNLGLLELDSANPEQASAHFAEALWLDAELSAAREGLAAALNDLGQHERAARLRHMR
jgi:spermidine synthase